MGVLVWVSEYLLEHKEKKKKNRGEVKKLLDRDSSLALYKITKNTYLTIVNPPRIGPIKIFKSKKKNCGRILWVLIVYHMEKYFGIFRDNKNKIK